MKKIYSITLLLSLLFLYPSCKEELPDNNCCTCTAPFTETGAGTMSFDLNGTTWSPCNTNEKNGPSPGLSTQRNPINGYLHIKSQKFINGGEETVYIILLHPKKGLIQHAKQGIWELTQGKIALELFANNPNIQSNDFYETDENLPFHLEITKLDTINKIISGIFTCSLQNTGSSKPDTVQIQNGRFDTRYL